ncbi:MAG: PepSY-associated TM helix domain-containing protein [Acidovorax sp.]
MLPRRLKLWRTAHTWSSLVCTLFLLVLCLTGLPLIFSEEIDGWLESPSSQAEAVRLPPGGVPLDAGRHVAAALALHGDEVAGLLGFLEDRTAAYVVTYRAREGLDRFRAGQRTIPGEQHLTSFDLFTGAVLRTTSAGLERPGIGRQVMEIIRDLHTDWFLGLAGNLFFAFMGLLFVLATVSGVVLYGPYMSRRPFGAVRADRSSRLKWLDLHNLLGIATMAWVLVVGATGVINDLDAVLSRMWDAVSYKPLRQKYSGEVPVEAPMTSWQAAIDAGRRAQPDLDVERIVPPGAFSPAHFLLEGHGITPLTEKLHYAVLVDARTGEVTDVVTVPWYIKILLLSRPLHFGDYGGLPMKVLWALLDVVTIIVLASGLYLWLARRRARERAASEELVRQEARA